MAWVLLVAAGLLEIGWAVGLKHTAGFTRPLPTAATVIAMAASRALLGLSGVRILCIGLIVAGIVGSKLSP